MFARYEDNRSEFEQITTNWQRLAVSNVGRSRIKPLRLAERKPALVQHAQ